MNPDRIRSIVIVGGGTAGWMTAATLTRMLGPGYCRVTLVESEEIGVVGVGEASIPMISTFNRMLGIDEDEFVRRVNATFKLGIQFVDWARKGHAYFHPFGGFGLDMEGVSFHAFWLKLRQAGDPRRITDFSLQAAAAAQGKFMRPINAGPGSFLNEIAHAFHFDAALYARWLRELAQAQGVVRREGRIVGVATRPGGGFIEAVILADSARIEGDLFIDCSGFRSLLLGQALGSELEDWSHWLPCDRAVAVPCDRAEGPLAPYTRSTADTAGWRWRIPLQHRTGNGYVYASRWISDDEATATLLKTLDAPAQAEPRLLQFKAGLRRRAWIGNCVALGLAAGFMEPLESTSIHLVQSGVARLLEAFPDRSFPQAEIDRFNRATAQEWELIRDFLILHYKATQRDDAPLWRACREMEIPENLAEKIRVFERYGRVFREKDELFTDTSWFAVMIGQLVEPQGYDPRADVISDEENLSRMDDIAAAIRRSADYMPGHAEFIAAHCAAGAMAA